MQEQTRTLVLHPRAAARWLAIIVVGFLLAHVGGQLSKYVLDHDQLKGLVPLFDMDLEMNAPTLFSTWLLLGTAALLSAITAMKRAEADVDWAAWLLLAVGFFAWMSVDESWSAHEKLVEPMRALLGGGRLGVFSYAWVVPALVVVPIVGMLFLGFLRRLPGGTRWRFVVAAAVYLGGAIGFEMLAGRYAEVHGAFNLGHAAFVACEETMEMLGVVLFIRALLMHIAEAYGEIRITVARE